MCIMCLLSTHSWLTDTMFRKIDGDTRFTSLAFVNCSLFVCYLLWDLYCMTLCVHRTAIYRADLVFHHFAALACYALMSTVTPLLGSRVLVGEYLSLMNTSLSGPTLRAYRVCVLCAIRLPMWVYFLCYYGPYFMDQFLTPSNVLYSRLVLYPSFAFGLGYDAHVLWKLQNSPCGSPSLRRGTARSEVDQAT